MTEDALKPLNDCQDAWRRFSNLHPGVSPEVSFYTGFAAAVAYCRRGGVPMEPAEALIWLAAAPMREVT